MFNFGVDYYPEHWPQERWARDAALMGEAGINTVRLAEFAWSLLEPEPDTFDFHWLDEAIEILQAHGVGSVILGTPTASPPPWVMEMLSDPFRVRRSGRRLTYGGRRGYCHSHPGFLERCRSVTSAMADHYAEHPAVIGWQVDNEFSTRCYCSICQARFQEWLKEKYGTLDALNEAWGTVFWSHVYTDWSQIPVPLDDGWENSYGPNPGLDLDFRRFSSDAIVRFQQHQVDILRKRCPNHFITHNTGFGLRDVDFFDIARPLDHICLDRYPRDFLDLRSDVDVPASALMYDTVRGLKGQGFWMTEMQGGPSGWRTISAAPRPGELRLWTYQALAHGADGMIYFRWRTALFGAEQYWHGVLDHHGEPGRRYEEISRVGAELKQVGDQIKGAMPRAKTALVLSYDTRFSFQNQPNHPDFDYMALLQEYYAALHGRNIAVDIVTPTADLSSYDLVLAPALYVVGNEAAENLHRFVAEGGTLLLTARSGVKDETNAVVNKPLPGLLAQMTGAEVVEYDVLPAGVDVPVRLELPGDGREGDGVSCRLWVDVLEPTTAETVARYGSDYYAGEAAVTLNAFGDGRVLYLGTLGGPALQDAVVAWLAEEAGVEPVLETTADLEIVERWKGDRRFLFVMNHSDEIQTFSTDERMVDLLTGQTVEGDIALQPTDVSVLSQQ